MPHTRAHTSSVRGTPHARSGIMKSLIRATVPIAMLTGVVALVGCGGSSKSTGEAQTTSGKVDKEKAKAIERLDETTKLIESFREKVPASVAQRAQCVVAIPSMAKGGLIVGGAGGKGYSTCRTSAGWSPPAPVSVSGGTFGAQIGYQEIDLVSVVTSAKGADALATGNFKVGADASATAGPVGTGTGAGTELETKADMLSYSRSKGLFAGAELNGSTIKLDQDSANGLYGPGHDMHAILLAEVPAPAETQNFLNAVRSIFGEGRK
jgi:lipid-binding SYLF domain-containing protein